MIFPAEAGTPRFSYSGLHAFDADGVELRARIELEDEHLRLRIETEGARYPIIVDPLVAAFEVKLFAAGPGGATAQAGDRFGRALAMRSEQREREAA